jgi:hypothetical protein
MRGLRPTTIESSEKVDGVSSTSQRYRNASAIADSGRFLQVFETFPDRYGSSALLPAVVADFPAGQAPRLGGNPAFTQNHWETVGSFGRVRAL